MKKLIMVLVSIASINANAGYSLSAGLDLITDNNAAYNTEINRSDTATSFQLNYDTSVSDSFDLGYTASLSTYPSISSSLFLKYQLIDNLKVKAGASLNTRLGISVLGANVGTELDVDDNTFVNTNFNLEKDRTVITLGTGFRF